jgi:hypothetical protein
MSSDKKRALIKEAQMQSDALKRLSQWRMTLLAFSAAGAVISAAGFFGAGGNLFLKIAGIILMILGFAAAAVVGLGIRNGSRNVEKILKAAEREGQEQI